MTEPLSPQWEDCKVCGGDHWTKDHPTDPDWAAMVSPINDTDGGHDDR